MASYQRGDVVWVAVGQLHEEPGTVLKVGCERREESDDLVEEQETWVSDGIMVKLHVSHMRAIYAPHEVRPLHDDNDDVDGNERKQRNTRSDTPSAKGNSQNHHRSVVTPSPSSIAAEDTDNNKDAKKPAAKRKRGGAKKDVSQVKEEAKSRKKTESKEESTESPYFRRKAASATKKVAVAASSSSSSASVSSKPSAKAGGQKKKATVKKKPRIVVEQEDDGPSNPSSSSSASDDNSSSDESAEDRPFMVEYAPTSRSTCRRCDQAILKGTVRVSHVPLFRGKPGFRVYRHLQCALFSEEIQQAEDVGGWKALDKEDLEALVMRVEESKLEMEQEDEEIQPDELVQVNFQGEIRKPPDGLSATLLPFQTEGVSWMYHQEVHVEDIRGGILADEMGMGKTLQTIVTVLDNRPKLQHCKPGMKHAPGAPDLDMRVREEKLWGTSVAEWKHEMEMNNVARKLWPRKLAAARAGTLVVCPVIALSQWKSEIEKFTENGALSVVIYHGPNRASELPPEMMRKYDVVITTYQVLEQDFRKMVSPNKVACPNCGGKFKIDKLKVHLKYFCGEGAQRTEAQARQRRTADRHQGRGQGDAKRSKGNAKKKPPMTKAMSKKPATNRKTIRLKSTSDYDSDSELSIDSATDLKPTKRPSRSAAVTASKKVSASVKEWGITAPISRKRKAAADDEDDDDESSFDSESDESSIESEDDESSADDVSAAAVPKKKRGKPSRSSQKQDDAIERAREKQRQALAQVSRSKKTGKTNKKKPQGKGKGKDKKFDSSSDESSSDDESAVDPMAGIDMDELMKEAMAGSRFSVLHSFCWWRIVLDEAHFIKSRSSQTAAAAFSLTGIHRWALSGTPLQNRVGELYSLIRFLRIDPMAHYFCRQKDCTCKSIHYRMVNGKCQDCGHRPFSHFAHFNKHVLNPIQRDGYTGDGRRAMFKLKNEVLDKCLLRRTKVTKAEDMNLPPRIVTIRSVRLHPVEEDFYNALYTQTKSSFDDYVAEGTLLNNYAHIFDLLTKMRQAVDHPYLIVYSKKNMEKQLSGQQVANGSVDCDMCHEPPTERVVSSCCGAGFCRSCVIEYLTGSVGSGTPCPSCEAPFTIDLNQAASDAPVDDGTLTLSSAPKNGDRDSSAASIPSLKELPHVATRSILRRINLAEFATSTKIEVLVQELVEMRKKRPGSKALVFSQFVNMLDLVRWRLHSDPCLAELGLGVRILHGGMDAKSRDAALKDFREDNGCRVLLMSLKAAGVALNLTVASECFLLDLWWNPAAEMQAIDRTHRLGQYRPIRAVRFVAEGTVEERVLQLQEKKRLVFDGTIGRDAGSLKMLTVQDMVSLFA